MEALLPGTPLRSNTDGPCSAPSSSKPGEREYEGLEVDQYYAGVQPGG